MNPRAISRLSVFDRFSRTWVFLRRFYLVDPAGFEPATNRYEPVALDRLSYGSTGSGGGT